MRCSAYTLIEGIVSMVILSLLLSISVLISFNLYRTLPAEKEISLENRAKRELDSLVNIHAVKSMTYRFDKYQVVYHVSDFEDMKNVKIATLAVTDSMENEKTKKKIFYLERED